MEPLRKLDWGNVWDYEDKQTEEENRLKNKTLSELVDMCDKLKKEMQTDEDWDDDKYKEMRFYQREVCKRLGIFHIDTLKNWFEQEVIPELDERFERLDIRMRNHRHDTTKQVSGKAEF